MESLPSPRTPKLVLVPEVLPPGAQELGDRPETSCRPGATGWRPATDARSEPPAHARQGLSRRLRRPRHDVRLTHV